MIYREPGKERADELWRVYVSMRESIVDARADMAVWGSLRVLVESAHAANIGHACCGGLREHLTGLVGVGLDVYLEELGRYT